MTIRQSPFAMVPIEAASDHRLTAMQYRVLIAILSFRNKNTDTAYPRRELIAERCGYSINTISRITAQLVGLGWLEKTGKGGRSSPSKYRINVPETVADPETVAGSETVADPDTKTLADPDTKTVADPARGKEQTIEQTKEQRGARNARTDVHFDAFWESYPTVRRRDKKKAREAWKRKKLDAMSDTVIADVQKRQAEDAQWIRGYIPMPTTYLNGERWEDVIEPPAGDEETNDPFAGAL